MRICTLAVIVTCLGLAGCVTAKVDASFDPQAGAYINEIGTGRLEGSALLRQRGGGVVTAAGNDVYLAPVTEYSTARVRTIYGDGKFAAFTRNFENTPDEYMKQTRKTKADVEGRFIFENLRAGEYYVITEITWEVPGNLFKEGGTLYERVTVSEGKTVSVVLSGT